MVACLSQAAQAQQWDAERRDIELKAAQWCEAEVQTVRHQAADTLAALEAKSDLWSVLGHIWTLMHCQQNVLACIVHSRLLPCSAASATFR